MVHRLELVYYFQNVISGFEIPLIIRKYIYDLLYILDSSFIPIINHSLSFLTIFPAWIFRTVFLLLAFLLLFSILFLYFFLFFLFLLLLVLFTRLPSDIQLKTKYLSLDLLEGLFDFFFSLKSGCSSYICLNKLFLNLLEIFFKWR